MKNMTMPEMILIIIYFPFILIISLLCWIVWNMAILVKK